MELPALVFGLKVPSQFGGYYSISPPSNICIVVITGESQAVGWIHEKWVSGNRVDNVVTCLTANDEK